MYLNMVNNRSLATLVNEQDNPSLSISSQVPKKKNYIDFGAHYIGILCFFYIIDLVLIDGLQSGIMIELYYY